MPDKSTGFQPVDTKQDFPALEKDILKFWEETDAFTKRAELNRPTDDSDTTNYAGQPYKHWSFIDGPITANNPMGVHHAWGRTYKDTFQRFRAMQGFDQRYQNGFDCQGLWVEVEVEKDLGLNSKREIIDYGLDKFSRACRDRVIKYAGVQTEQSKRLGQWMDWDNSYFTMSEGNNLTIWHFLKKVHENGWLYKGDAVVPWCTRCGTALSQHELSDGGYADITHKTVYVTFKRQGTQGTEDEYFLVWTTTPWTLSSNVSLAVNPGLTYVKIAGPEGKTYILSKAVAVKKFKDADILEEFSGVDLVDTSEGAKYEPLYPDLPVQETTQRLILPWDEVGEEEGTGIVHIAPGCGEEDAKLGKEYNLDNPSPLDEFGTFSDKYGEFAGMEVQGSADRVIDDLKSRGLLERVESITHRYPRCWRCKTECVFRAVDEWFMDADAIRPRLKEAAATIDWMPESSGKRMQDWLDNMGNWIISRKRFWGLALPFYECQDCNQITVIGSKEELKERATDPSKVDELESLHRPWIDDITITCECGQNEVKRVPDVGDCWLDAGIVPYSTLNYLGDHDYWEKWFPANFIVESRPQIRLWFYSQLFMSVVLEDKAPYERAMTYESVVDETGHEMHKSAGNSIPFDEGADKMGADVMRWMYLADTPTKNLRFGFTRGEEVRKKLLSLWNTYAFFVSYANIDGVTTDTIATHANNFKPTQLLDKWLLAELQRVISTCTAALENYDSRTAISTLDEFIERLSNWYVRRSRRRFWASADTTDTTDKMDAYVTLYSALMTVVKLLAPALPFLSESIYQNLRTASDPESVHHNTYPELHPQFQDDSLTETMNAVLEIAALGRSARANSNIKLRQPLSEVLVQTNLAHIKDDATGAIDLIKDELNVKDLVFIDNADEYATPQVFINARELGPRIGAEVQRVIAAARNNDYEFDGHKLIIDGHELSAGEYTVNFQTSDPKYAAASEQGTIVILNTEVTPALKQEGIARELIRAIQQERQRQGLDLQDRVQATITVPTKEAADAANTYDRLIKDETLSVKLTIEVNSEEEEVKVDITKT